MLVCILSVWLSLPCAYTFFQDAQTVEPTSRGIRVYDRERSCLEVSFVDPSVVRITVQRPGDDAPLDYVLLPLPDPPPFWAHRSDSLVTLSTDSLTVTLTLHPCRVGVHARRTGTPLLVDDPGLGTGWWGHQVETWKVLIPHEGFFGLGEKAGRLNLKGRELVLWNTDNPHHDEHSDPLYLSVPFFVGVTKGVAYGVYLNNSSRTTFNFGAGNLRTLSFGAEAGPLDYFVCYGPRVPQVVERYTGLVGRTPMPPLWALGYQQSRWSYFPQEEVLRIARTFREKGIPADVLYLDIHHMDDYQVFTWHPHRFPNPRRMLDALASMGFKVAIIVDPGIKADTTSQLAREGLRGGHFLRYPDGQLYVGEVWPGPCYFPDFSQDRTQAWWADLVAARAREGVMGFWNDMNEPAVWGQAFPDEVVFWDGGRACCAKKMHNLYGLLMSKATHLGSTVSGTRRLVLTRAGFAGQQRYSAVWTGDNRATWEHLRMGIRMVQGMGISGIPFVGTDVGGFMGTPTPELFARWIQFGAVCPLFRTHTHHNTPDQEPWSFGEDVEEIARHTILWRYALLPYLYSLFWESHRTGAPLVRPLVWRFQDDPRVFDPMAELEFLLGDHLLVAPVTEPGQRLWEVYLPGGRWLHLATERVCLGPGSTVVEAPLGRMPTFLGEGGIVVSQEPMEYVGQRRPEVITVDAFPSLEPTSFVWYEDDGVSLAWQQGAFRTTELTMEGGNPLSFQCLPQHTGFDPGPRRLVIRFHACPPPATVTDRATPLHRGRSPGWEYDEASRVLTITLEDHREAHHVRVAFPDLANEPGPESATPAPLSPDP